MRRSPNTSFHLETMGFFFPLNCVVGTFHKFSICITKGLPSPVKVITVVMQNNVNFQCHIHVIIFIQVFNVSFEVIDDHSVIVNVSASTKQMNIAD